MVKLSASLHHPPHGVRVGKKQKQEEKAKTLTSHSHEVVNTPGSGKSLADILKKEAIETVGGVKAYQLWLLLQSLIQTAEFTY